MNPLVDFLTFLPISATSVDSYLLDSLWTKKKFAPFTFESRHLLKREAKLFWKDLPPLHVYPFPFNSFFLIVTHQISSEPLAQCGDIVL